MHKRTIKIKFIDYWNSFYDNEMEDCLIMRILRKHYNVEICDDADYRYTDFVSRLLISFHMPLFMLISGYITMLFAVVLIKK